jgi:hypothetical protein
MKNTLITTAFLLPILSMIKPCINPPATSPAPKAVKAKRERLNCSFSLLSGSYKIIRGVKIVV